jgi:hypothetical protein
MCTLQPLDGSSIWAPRLGTHPSCTSPAFDLAAAAKIGRRCAEDPTSLDLDLSRLASDGGGSSTGCPHFESVCHFDVARVGSISFDVEMRQCGDVWACPLWMSPRSWRPPQHASGEIDFVENCKGSLNLSFGEAPPYFAQWPGRSAAALGRQHVRLDFEPDGSVLPTMTDAATGQSVTGLHLTGGQSYRAQTSQNWKDNPFSLISDIWNGVSGDAGYAACQGRTAPQSRCGYTVSNVKIASNDGSQLFSGTCAALNP